MGWRGDLFDGWTMVLGYHLVFFKLIQASSTPHSLLSVSNPGGKLLPRVQKARGWKYRSSLEKQLQGFSMFKEGKQVKRRIRSPMLD
jgi:hypothetical protein